MAAADADDPPPAGSVFDPPCPHTASPLDVPTGICFPVSLARTGHRYTDTP
jgi:hypothetical protein